LTIRKQSRKEAIYRSLCRMGLQDWSRQRHATDLTILMYHGLVADQSGTDPSWLLLPLERFEEQLAYLAANYQVISVADAARHLAERRPFERPTACITFDDGYRNNFTLGFPILQRMGLPATIYLATSLIGTHRVIWTIMLEQALLTTSVTNLDLTEIGLGNYPLGSPGQFENEWAREELKKNLYRLRWQEREQILADIFGRLGYDHLSDLSAFRAMSWEEARIMRDSGLIDFGGHTVHHEVVSELDDAGIEEEIEGSISTIESHLGKRPLSFAYPNGRPEDFDERAKAAVVRAGGIAALSTIEGLNSPSEDRYALKRISVDSEMSLPRFQLLVSGLIPDLRRWLRGDAAESR
jgi:peptidoglycan/xylan/chitin deacetylase (PgdA/CDA1 family)